MSQIVDTIKGIPGDIIKLPTTIYNFATGSYYGVPVATFGLIGITTAALVYVTLTQTEPKEGEDSEEREDREPIGDREEREPIGDMQREEREDREREDREPIQREVTGGKKKTIRKRGKKKTIKKKSIRKAHSSR